MSIKFLFILLPLVLRKPMDQSIEIKIKKDALFYIKISEIQELLLWVFTGSKKPKYIGILNKELLKTVNLVYISDKLSKTDVQTIEQKMDVKAKVNVSCNFDISDLCDYVLKKTKMLDYETNRKRAKKKAANLDAKRKIINLGIIDHEDDPVNKNYNDSAKTNMIIKGDKKESCNDEETGNLSFINAKNTIEDNAEVKKAIKYSRNEQDELELKKYAIEDFKLHKTLELNIQNITKESIKDFIVKDWTDIYKESEFYANKEDHDFSRLNDFTILNGKSKYFLIAIDCEMVQTVAGTELGRLSILDSTGQTIYDKYIKPEEEVVDLLTKHSGITENDLIDAISFDKMKDDLCKIAGANTTILGHALFNDLYVLKIKHTKLIDTSFIYCTKDKYKISLKNLARVYLNRNIQEGSHCSVEDARVCLELLSLKISELKEYKEGNNYLDFNCKISHYKDEFLKPEMEGLNTVLCTFKLFMKRCKFSKNSLNLIFYAINEKIYMIII